VSGSAGGQAGAGSAGVRLIAAVAAGATGAGAARLAYSVMKRRPPGGTKLWSRTNHRAEAVTLLEGPAVAAGAIAGLAAQAGLGAMTRSATWRPGASWRSSAAMALAGAGAAAFGAYDDLAGSGDRRGFGGHLGALRQGEVTTGAVKLGGIGATGILSAAVAGGSPADVVINAGLIAGGANLLNLFDLRPGRAIKVAVAAGALIAASGESRKTAARAAQAGTVLPRRAVLPPRAALALAAPAGAALALLPEDLGERAMLGDCGANALGAMLGASAVGLPRPARIALLAGIAGLTAASEKVSFTKVIERTPALRWLDMLGRRPARQEPVVSIPAQRQSAMSMTGASTTARSADKTDIPPPEE
jgi:UDP-N-acetylmuramyl pentapeptide phosphotransferase/UDP-N-acetylglucosamine-1-phosphate transferase